jgi:plasmid stability protein
MLHVRVSVACAGQLKALAAQNDTSVNAEARAILESGVPGTVDQDHAAEPRHVEALAIPDAPLLPPELLEAVQAAATRRAAGISVTPAGAVEWALRFALQEEARAIHRLATLRRSRVEAS